MGPAPPLPASGGDLDDLDPVRRAQYENQLGAHLGIYEQLDQAYKYKLTDADTDRYMWGGGNRN